MLMGEDAVERHLMSADKMQKKVRLMKGRNNYVHKVFGDDIPATEKVIEDFGCSYGGVSGRVFFTQNYILFCNGELLNPSKLVKSKLALYKVTGATKESGVLLPSSICVTDEEGFMHKYTGFAALVRNKAFAVLEHLMQHQPLYATLRAQAPQAEPEKAAPAPRPASAPPQVRQMEEELDYLSGRWGELSQGWEEQKRAQRASAALYEKPDTALVKDAIRTVYEINNIGKNVITRMDEQATMIDNVEDHLDDTAANIRNGDVKLDSVDSIAGAVVGSLKGTVKARHHERVRAGLDGEKYYDIPILVKHSLGALQHAVLRLGPNEFCCVDPVKDTSFVGSVMRTGFWKTLSGGDSLKEAPEGEMPLMRDYKYSYDSVGAVVIRCRPQHIDIRFHDGTERFRCMTSYVQAVANEMVLRCGASRVSVIFEPHARRFQYNDEKLRRMIKLKPPRVAGLECDNTFVIQDFEKTTDTVITNAPKEVADALDEQDKGVDELQELMRHVNANTDHIGRESRRQVEQLKHVNALASDVNASASKTAHKAHRME